MDGNMQQPINKTYSVGDAQIRPAYNFEPERDAQGATLDKIKAYGKMVIPEDEAKRMNCATFTDLELLFPDIKEETNIRVDRVYPALRKVGYDTRWNDKCKEHGDIFTDLNELVKRCETSKDRDLKLMVKRRAPLFVDVRSIKVRVPSQIEGIAVDDADNAGLSMSHLNLYLVLRGVKTLVENEPTWIERQDDDDIHDVLRVLQKADKSLLHQRRMLTGVLGQ